MHHIYYLRTLIRFASIILCRRLKSRAVYLTDLALSYKGHGVCAFSYFFRAPCFTLAKVDSLVRTLL
jgi:hypothetical protein